MKLPTINKTYLILKAHFFFFQAGIAPSQTAAPVYAQTLGFSSFIVGLVYTILPLLALVIKPASGAIADRFRWHKQVMLAVEIIIMLSYFSLQFIPSGYTPPPKVANASSNYVPMPRNISFSFCPGVLDSHPYIRVEKFDLTEKNPCTTTCELTPDLLAEWCSFLPEEDDTCSLYQSNNFSHPATAFKQNECRTMAFKNWTAPVLALKNRQNTNSSSHCSVNCADRRNTWDTKDGDEDSDDDEPDYQDDSITLQQYQFYVFLLLVLGGWGGTTVVTTLSDTICITKCDDPYDYGKQRLWGSIGYGVLSIVSGLIVDGISGSGPKDYTPAFYMTLATLGLDIVMTHFLIKVEIPEQSENIAKDVWKTFLNIRLLVFILWCVAMGVSMGLTWTFLYWLLEDLARQQGPDTVSNIKTIEGLTNGVQTFLGETPAFFFAGWVLSKIGHSHCMTVILFTIGLRFTIYSFLTNPWFVLFVEPLQLYYGLFYCTMTSYANIVAPPGTQATIQSIMCAMCEGVGVAIGSFVGGYLYGEYKGPTTFRIFGIAFFIMAVCNEGFELLFRFLPSTKEQVNGEESSQKEITTSVSPIDA